MSYRFRDHSKSDTSRDADDGKSMGNNSNDSKGPPDRMFGAMDNDKSSRDDTDDRFSKYGKSTDSNRSRRPALYGRGRRPSPTRDKGYGDRGRDYPYSRDDVASRDRSPMRGSFDDRFADRYKKDEGLYPRRDELGRKDLQRTPVFDDLLREKYSGLETRSRYDIQGNFNSRYEAPDDPYKLRQLNYPSVYKDYYKNEGMPKPNECEIIVVNKMQRPYAETVEQRMKNLGIQVDILFLKDEGLLIQTIDDIARRGSLYAVVISPQNEVHGSVTLNILYGTPQEHRNMPLDDALKLVARNYHEHIRTQREGTDRERVERGPYVGALPADREIQFLLRVLADGRTISLDEIETVIRYLQERRDKLKSTQGDRTPVASIPPDLNVVPPAKIKEEPPVLSQKQQDLQHRIMNLITHGGQGSGAGSPAVAGNSGGMSVSQSVSGSMVPGSGLGQNPSGAGRSQPPLGPNPSNMGSHQPGIGHNDPNISTKLPEMGLKQHGIGQNQSVIGGLGSNHSVPGSNQSSIVTNQPGMGLNTQPTSSPSTYINFDNPSVQKALDNLMQSGGPNLLKNISLTGSVTCGSQGIPGNSQMKQPPPSNVGSSINPQSGPGPMGDHSGSMGPGIVHQQVGNMGHQPGSSMSRQSASSMSHQPGSNMGHQQGSNMGHQTGSNMGHQPSSNMGHQPGSNMGHQPGSNMSHQQGSNMSHQQGSNMSHQPSSNMNHQQSGSNISHQQSNSMSHQQGGTLNQQQQGGNNMGHPQGPGMGLHQGPNIGPGPMSGMGTGHGPFPGPGMYGIGPNMMGHLPPRYPIMGGPTGNHSSMMGGMGGGPHRY